MKLRNQTMAFGLTATAGLCYLLDVWVASFSLEPCTSMEPVSPVPCDNSGTLGNWLSILALILTFLGIAVFVMAQSSRMRRIWGGFVVAISVGCYLILLVLISFASFSPVLLTYLWLGLLFLPGLAFGLAGASVGMRLGPPDASRPRFQASQT
jgi:MFS-type transporter involved in bile tolerance (Atg22 family)